MLCVYVATRHGMSKLLFGKKIHFSSTPHARVFAWHEEFFIPSESLF